MTNYFELPQETNKYFPAHGWAESSSGVRILRFPILSLYRWGGPKHEFFYDNKIAGVWLQSRSPERTLNQLAVCFRDLHKEIREILPLFLPENKETRDITRQMEGLGRIEVSVIASFSLLRRLADDLINASRPFLFEHWKSAPRELKKMIELTDRGSIDGLNPRYDRDLLNDALKSHTSWFESLRKADSGGVRDILVHRPHILQIGASGSMKPDGSPINWRITASLVQESNDHKLKHIDLFPVLLDCIDGACIFMKLFCESVGLSEGYDAERRDMLFLTGSDNDIVGFWPPIASKRTEFPILD